MFWSLTLREIQQHFRAAARRQEREDLQHRWNVWHIAALQKGKKFPSFKEFVKPPAPKARRQQSAEEQIAVTRQWLANRKRRN